MKLSKILISTGLFFSIFGVSSITNVKAESGNDDRIITPLACPEVGTYVTTYKSKTTSTKQDFSHTATNPSSSPDSVSKSASISHSATVNIGGETTFNALVSGAKISANVGYGFNSGKTLTLTWSVPKGTWELRAGSKWVKSTGTRYYVSPPCNLTKATTVTANYTHDTWSDKIKK